MAMSDHLLDAYVRFEQMAYSRTDVSITFDQRVHHNGVQDKLTSSVKRTMRPMGLVLGSRRCEQPRDASTHTMRTVWAAAEPEHVRVAQPAAGVISAMADGEADHCNEFVSNW